MSLMIGPLLLLMVANSPNALQPAPASTHAAKFTPTRAVTERARASVRIISGVRFGPEHAAEASGATPRSVRLTDQAGQLVPARLLEFQ
jgi:hypothetical protein